ncbi:MAG TPA: polyphosphate kinase 2 family protein [Dongiaceae bacterium]|nr:polyphosphate kinase 2 family protein [Dongiaceae bacterium]
MAKDVHYSDKFRVKPGHKLRLKKIDAGFKGHHETEEAAAVEIEHYRHKMAKMQSLLYAEKKRSVLIVLQALDAGGKDGTVNHVFSVLNPQGARVVGFKQPTSEELAHDFLWRVHPHVPIKGEITIFNRSHYEDVLVTRVHKLIDKETWEDRYRRIRAFEELLAHNGTHILKFFLHISAEEQLARFAQRLEDPQRNWKISESDYAERAYWDDYVAAFEDAITATTAKHAPWFVIPANHKWFRNLAVSRIIADTMEDLHMAYPEPKVDLADIRRKYHAAERAARRGKRSAKKRG